MIGIHKIVYWVFTCIVTPIVLNMVMIKYLLTQLKAERWTKMVNQKEFLFGFMFTLKPHEIQCFEWSLSF